MKPAWQKLLTNSFADIKLVLDALLVNMQPRWAKGMAAVIATHAIVSTSTMYVSLNLNIACIEPSRQNLLV